MEDIKLIAEDIIEENNGVYGCKWLIVSPEGFDLPKDWNIWRTSGREAGREAIFTEREGNKNM